MKSFLTFGIHFGQFQLPSANFQNICILPALFWRQSCSQNCRDCGWSPSRSSCSRYCRLICSSWIRFMLWFWIDYIIEIKVNQWMLIIEIVKSTFPCIHWYHNIPIVYHQQCSTTVLPHHHLDFYSNCDHWCNHLVSFPIHVANLSMTYIWVRPFKFSK